MKWKQHDAEVKDALSFLSQIRFRAYVDSKTFAKPGNPFEPIPGMEKEFEDAMKTIRRVNVIRWELDSRAKRRRLMRSITAKTLDALIYILITIGFMGLLWIGLTFVGLYFDLKPLVLFISMVFVAGACEAINLIKARKRRK